MLGVLHLGMELDTVDRTVPTSYRFIRTGGRRSRHIESLWDDLDLIVMGCPYLERVRETFEQVIVRGNLETNAPELRNGAWTELPAEMLADELHACADSEYREIRLVEILSVVPHARGVARHAGSSSREDETIHVGDLLEGSRVRDDLGIDLEVSEDAPFAMRPLPSVVDDVDLHATATSGAYICLSISERLIMLRGIRRHMGISFANKSYVKLKECGNEFVDLVSGMIPADERVLKSFKAGRDGVVFTTERLITINVMGVTGKQKAIAVLPYSRISAYEIETASVIDMDATLTLWISGLGETVLEFTCRTDLSTICRCINGCK